MHKIVLVTCLKGTDPLFAALAEEMNNSFNPEKAIVTTHHGDETSEKIIAQLIGMDPSVPLEVGFDFSCNIARIGSTMRSVKEQLNGRTVRFYYRKNGDETLPISMQKLSCFKKLQEKFAPLLAA